jgi:hypothetical protein
MIQDEPLTVETAIEHVDEDEVLPRQAKNTRVIQPNEEVLRIKNFPHNPEKVFTTTTDDKKISKVKKVLTSLPHYRPALKVLNLFKDSPEEQDLFEDFKAIDSEMDWINLPLQDLDAGDIPLYQHFRIALAHNLPEYDEDHTTRTAFYTSVDEERLVSDFLNTDSQYKCDIFHYDETEEEKFYTARKNSRPSNRLSHAFHLDTSGKLFTRSTTVEKFLDDMSDR